MNRFLLVQCILIILIACSASKKSISILPEKEPVQVKTVALAIPVSTQLEKDTIPVVFKIDTVFKMSRGACIGNCPVYTLTILNDGTVIWTGISNTSKLGMHVAKLDQRKINDLQLKARLFISQGFKSFYPDKNHEIIADFPTAVFNFFDHTQTKKIVVNHSAPKILYELSDQIETWLENTEWIKIEP